MFLSSSVSSFSSFSACSLLFFCASIHLLDLRIVTIIFFTVLSVDCDAVTGVADVLSIFDVSAGNVIVESLAVVLMSSSPVGTDVSVLFVLAKVVAGFMYSGGCLSSGNVSSSWGSKSS